MVADRILGILNRLGLADADDAFSTAPQSAEPWQAFAPQPQNAAAFPPEQVEDFFADYPPTTRFVMSDGAETRLPMHIQDMAVLQVIGRVSPKVMNPVLRPHDVEVLSIPLLGGLASIAAVDYRKTSIGAYQELVIGVLARSLSNPKITGFHMLQLYVTTEISKLLGREAWGFPKDIANITLDPYADKTQGFKATLPDGTFLATGNWHKGLVLPSKVVEKPYHTPRMWVETAARRKSPRMGRASPSSVTFNSGTKWGKLLTEAGFRPLIWQALPANMAVLLPPR